MDVYADQIRAEAEQVRAAHDLAKDRGARYAASFWWYIWHNLRTLAGEYEHSAAHNATMARLLDRTGNSELKRGVYANVKSMEEGSN